MDNTFDTIVAGITKKNDEGLSIQKILKSYVEENYDTNRFDKDDFEYWSNKEIEEYDTEVNQYEMQEFGTITLVPEPDNPYDSNAIKVIHKNMGMIGYIPKEDNVNLMNFISRNNNQVETSLILEGGPYKHYDIYTDKVKKVSKPLYIRLFVSPINKKIENATSSIQSSNSNEASPFTYPQPQYKYDLFEFLAATGSEYPNPRKNIEPLNDRPHIDPVVEPQPAEIKTEPKPKVELKNPIVNLTVGIISLVVFVVLVIFRRFISSLLFLLIGLVNLTAYMKYKR